MLVFKQMGMWGPLLVIIAIVVVALIVRAALRLSRMTPEIRNTVGTDIHAILFWGGVSALLGFIGQNSGLYNALTVISQAREISPAVVAMGFAESLTTTLFGMTTLLVAAIAWFTLLVRYRRSLQ
jgi:biopolymer transport protein ExbB/TolQ